MTSSSSSSALFDLKTHFDSKIGVHSPAHDTLVWTATNGVRIIAYLDGRGTSVEAPSQIDGEKLEVLISVANEVLSQERKEAFSQRVTTGKWPFQHTVTWHVFFSPRLAPIVTAFNKTPQIKDSLINEPFDPKTHDPSTPYTSLLSREELGKHQLSFSTHGLPSIAHTTLHTSIKEYFNLWNGLYSGWGEFANENYFKPWCDGDMEIEAYPSFCTVAWATMAHYVLGIPRAEFVDYSFVWNALRDDTQPPLKRVGAEFWHYNRMQSGILEHIRKKISDYSPAIVENLDHPHPENIIHYWIRKNIVGTVVPQLTEAHRTQAYEMARDNKMTLEEMLYLHWIFELMIEMQENSAIVMTEISCQFIKSYDLLLRCRIHNEDCMKMVREALRHTPPAPSMRRLRWDTDVVDIQKGHTYQGNKGDVFISIPAIAMNMDTYTTRPKEFLIDRRLEHCVAFSEGPNSCPVRINVLLWLAGLTSNLARYPLSIVGEMKSDYYFSPKLRDNQIKLKLSLYRRYKSSDEK